MPRGYVATLLRTYPYTTKLLSSMLFTWVWIKTSGLKPYFWGLSLAVDAGVKPAGFSALSNLSATLPLAVNFP